MYDLDVSSLTSTTHKLYETHVYICTQVVKLAKSFL